MATFKRKWLRFWAACIGAAAYILTLHREAFARKPVASALFVLGLLAAPGMAGRVEAQLGQSTHQAILGAVGNVPPAWSETLPAAARFVLVLGEAAVLDRETGLVWEQAPDSESDPADRQIWLVAQGFCINRTVGNRKGWRLPTIQELASLVDPGNPDGNPDLPPAHPFTNVQSSFYWSATTIANFTSLAWGVNLFNGDGDFGDKDDSFFAWCVRGGQGVDPQ